MTANPVGAGDQDPSGSGLARPAGATMWRKSSRCGSSSECVEVTVTYDASAAPHKAGSGKLYLMRNSKDPGGPVLAFTEAEWEAFVLGVKDGEFDLPEDAGGAEQTPAE